MPITIMTDLAEPLLDAIHEGIEDRTIRTWKNKATKKGDIFMYKAEQYADLACLKAVVKNDMLLINIGKVDNQPISKELKGIYFGRFVQMITSHFYGQYN